MGGKWNTEGIDKTRRSGRVKPFIRFQQASGNTVQRVAATLTVRERFEAKQAKLSKAYRHGAEPCLYYVEKE